MPDDTASAATMAADKLVNRLRKEFARQKLSYYRLGKLTGGQPTGLKKVMDGKVRPTFDTAVAIAKALGLEFSFTKLRSI